MARLFVSDVHLDAATPAAAQRFTEFLTTHAVGTQALYILGDLFEAWVGDDDPEPQKRAICEALRTLTGSGVACYVQHGNRDFLFGQQFCALTGALVLPDPIIAEFDGERVLLTHGDALCSDDLPYQELRTIVRDPAWQKRFLSLPLAARTALADEARAGSRAHTSRTIPYIMDVNPQTVENTFRALRVNRMIHGHTHRPGIHDTVVDGEARQRIVLGAWYEQGTYLVCESGRYELRELANHRR